MSEHVVCPKICTPVRGCVNFRAFHTNDKLSLRFPLNNDRETLFHKRMLATGAV